MPKFIILGLLLIAGQPRSAVAAEAATSFESRDLEVRVWTADESTIPLLEREVTHLMQVNAKSVPAHHMLSHIFVRIFSSDPSDIYMLRQAADLAQQAVDLAPQDPAGYTALADILDLMGNTDGALKLLTNAESRGIKPNWRFAFTRARLSADSASTTKVLELLGQSLSFKDALPDIVVPYVVAVLHADTQAEDLISQLKVWNRKYPSQLFDLTLAITYSEQGAVDKAHEIYEAMLKINPKNIEAKINNAILLYRDLHQPKKAVVQLEQLLNDPKANLTPSLRSTVVSHLGAAFVGVRSWDKARRSFITAMDLETDRQQQLTDFIGKIYKGANAHANLASLLTELSEHASGPGQLYAMLGETLSERLSKHDAAIRAYTDAITLDPSRSDYYTGMGLALYRKKSYLAALKVFTTASELDPGDAVPRYNQACVLSLLGRDEESLQILAEAIALDPRLAFSAKTDRDFANISQSAKFRHVVDTTQESPTVDIAH